MSITKVFFHEKPVMMLITLYNSKNEIYASNLAKKVDCTYSHVIKMLQAMQENGLVLFNKQGRLKLLSLTDKGKEVAQKLDEAKRILELNSE